MADPIALTLDGAKQAYDIAKFLHQSFLNRKQNPKDIDRIFRRIQVVHDSIEKYCGDSSSFEGHREYVDDMLMGVDRLVKELEYLESISRKVLKANDVQVRLGKLTEILNELEKDMKDFSILLNHRQQFELMKTQLQQIKSDNRNIKNALNVLISLVVDSTILSFPNINRFLNDPSTAIASSSTIPISSRNISTIVNHHPLSLDAIEDAQLSMLENNNVDSDFFRTFSPFDNDVIQKGLRFVQESWELLYEDIKYRKSRGKEIIIGRGATSTVYKGFLKERDNYGDLTGNIKIPIAIKEIHKSESSDIEAYKKYYLREMTISKNTRHDCIITTYGGVWPNFSNSHHLEDDNIHEEEEEEDDEDGSEQQQHKNGSIYPIFITELMSHNIESALKKSMVFDSTDNQRKVAIDIANGLNFLHSKNIVHRDIKPQNILPDIVDNSIQGNAKIADFGVSRKIKNGNNMSYYASTKIQGTIIYMPPEVLSKEEDGTRKPWDVWSFGILMCHICQTGAVKDSTITPMNITDLSRSGELEIILRNWSNQIQDDVLKSVVQQCTKFNPRERISITEVLSTLTSAMNKDSLDQDLMYLLLNDLWTSVPGFPNQKWISVQDFKSKYVNLLNHNELDDLIYLQVLAREQALTSVLCYNPDPKELLFQIHSRLLRKHSSGKNLVNRYINAISKHIERPFVTSRSSCWKNSVVDHQISVGGELEASCVTDDRTRLITATKDSDNRRYIVVTNIKTGFMEKKICVRKNFEKRAQGVICIFVTKDSKWAVHGTRNGNVYVHDLNSENCLHDLELKHQFIKQVCVNTIGTTVVIRCLEELHVWDLIEDTVVRIRVQKSLTYNLHLINDDKDILCGSPKGIKILNVKDGSDIGTVRLNHKVYHTKVGGSKHTRAQEQTNSDFGGSFCVATGSKIVSVVDLDKLSVVWRTELYLLFNDLISAVSTPRYRRVALNSDEEVFVYDLISGHLIGRYPVKHDHDSQVHVVLLEFFGEDHLISGYSNGMTDIWSLEKVDKQPRKEKRSHISSFDVSVDESFVSIRHNTSLHMFQSVSVWDVKNCCEIFFDEGPHDMNVWSNVAFNSKNKLVGYCDVRTGEKDRTDSESPSKHVAALLKIVDIQARNIVVDATVHLEAVRNGYLIWEVKVEFVEDYFILNYKLKTKFGSKYSDEYEAFEAFKIISTRSNTITLQRVECRSHWKSIFSAKRNKSQNDAIYYKGRFVLARNDNAPDSIIATLPYRTAYPVPSYYNEETGVFIAAMSNSEIISLNVHN